MASDEYKLTVVEGTELTLSLNTGLQGPAGPAGPAGPNEITTATETNLTGYIYGNGTNVAGSTTASTTASPNTLALRDANGKLTASDLEIYVKAATTIPKGAVVYISGASGNNKIISLAQANTEALSSKTIGVAIQALATNGFGYVITEGDITDLGISLGSGHGVVEGDPIWLSPTVAGGMVFKVANKPSAPNHMVFVGYVTKLNGNTLDSIYVKVQNGFELEELHNVAISSPTTGQVIAYNATTGLWSNQSQAASTITTSTSTDLTGFIIGDGSTITGATAGSTSSTASTVAIRTSLGGLNAHQIRLNEDGNSFYIQINPPTGLTGSATLALPSSAGTIATSNTAVMLSGTQEVNGAKTFKNQVQLDGQSATDSNSAMTLGLTDSRYHRSFSSVQNASLSTTSTDYQVITSITLATGTYQINAIMALYRDSGTGNMKTALRFSNSVKTTLLDYYGATLNTTGTSIASDNATIFERTNTGTTEYRRDFNGIIDVITNNTVVELVYAQIAEDLAIPIQTRKRAFIVAHKLS
jgi:hypothetical protein